MTHLAPGPAGAGRAGAIIAHTLWRPPSAGPHPQQATCIDPRVRLSSSVCGSELLSGFPLYTAGLVWSPLWWPRRDWWGGFIEARCPRWIKCSPCGSFRQISLENIVRKDPRLPALAPLVQPSLPSSQPLGFPKVLCPPGTLPGLPGWTEAFD